MRTSVREYREELLRFAQMGKVDELKQMIRHCHDDGQEGHDDDDDGQLSPTSSSFNWKSIHNPKSGDTLMSLAARNGHLNVLRWLREDCMLDLDQSNFDSKKPIHEAAQFGHLDCLIYILSQENVDVDSLKKADWTALMLACTKDRLDIVKTLVENGAKLDLKNKDGWTPFHIACREGHQNIVEYLLDQDLNLWKTVSKNGRTPLHTAAIHGCQEVVEIILSQGDTTERQDSCGSTPIMDALRAGYIDIARLFIKRKMGDVALCDNLGRTVLHVAAEAGQTQSIEFLINEVGMDVNSASSRSCFTALHCAAKEGHHEVCRQLLSLGSQVTDRDNWNRTALHLASGSQHADCVVVLLHHGAQKDCVDKTNKKPIDYAIKSNVIEAFAVT